MTGLLLCVVVRTKAALHFFQLFFITNIIFRWISWQSLEGVPVRQCFQQCVFDPTLDILHDFLKRTRKGIEVGRWLCIDGFSRGLGMPRAPCGAPVKAVQRGLSIILMQFMEAARLKFGARGRGAHQTALASAPISALSLVINTGPRAHPTPGISAIPCKSPALTLNGFLQDYCH